MKMKSRTLSSRFQSKVAVAFALYRNHPSSRDGPPRCRTDAVQMARRRITGLACVRIAMRYRGRNHTASARRIETIKTAPTKKQIDCDELAGRFRKNKAEIESLRWQLDVVRRRVRPQAPSKALDIPARLVWSEFSW